MSSPSRQKNPPAETQVGSSAFNPSSLPGKYSAEIAGNAPLSPASSISSSSPARSNSDNDVFGDLSPHIASPPQRNTRGRLFSTHGFLRQNNQFEVDQSVNIMDHGRANYSTRSPVSRATSDGSTSSLVDILLSFRSTSSSRGQNLANIQEEHKPSIWPEICRWLLILMFFGVAATFLALSVPHMARISQDYHEAGEVDRWSAMSSIVISSGFTRQSHVERNSTSQHHALTWLSKTDPARIKPDDPRLLARYALAVFFYSNHPEIAYNHSNGQRRLLHTAWERDDQWMAGDDVCDWYGIECKEKEITQWNMSANNLRGEIPSEISILSKLELIDLSTNQLIKRVPTSVYKFSSLKQLILKDNSLTGTISKDIGYARNAEEIDLSDNHLTGFIPSSINTAVSLRWLSLAGNSLEGALPNMTVLSHLEYLALYKNKHTGKLPTSLARLTNLAHLNLEGNMLSGPIPQYLFSLTSLDILALGHNDFSGTIPDLFQSLLNLTEVRLQKNNFRGTLPASLGGLKSLKRILLDTNQLTGQIPHYWMNLAQVEAIILHDNKLAGSLSGYIQKLTHLQDLWLNQNSFEGLLPSQLGLLSDLSTLYVEDNPLSGTVPSQFSKMTSLQVLRLAKTNLTGAVPEGVCSLKTTHSLMFLTASCTGLRCLCCDKCL